MTPRSRVHMLNVAAARLEQDYGNPKLVADLREAAKHAAKQKAEGRFEDDQAKRIARQRTLFAMLPDTHALGKFKDAMLQRAYDLMWDGDGSGTDALVEFLPSADVERMFNAWERDQDPKHAEKSAFYAAGPGA